jgi:hypothetical protein
VLQFLDRLSLKRGRQHMSTLFRAQGSCPFPDGIPSMGADLRVTGVSAGPPSVFSTMALRLLRVEYRSPAANRGLCSCRPELLTLKLFAHTLKPATLMLADSVAVRFWQFRWQFDHCVLSAIHKPRTGNRLCHRQTAFLSLILLQPPRFGSRLTTLARHARPGG